jgi:hypothetical protein
MPETKAGTALVTEMLRYVPAAVPGAVSLKRAPGPRWSGYTLRYLKTRETLAMGEDPPGVETVELPIAAAWSVDFVVGIVLILLGMVVAVLLPPATHERVLALVAVIFVVIGLAELWRSRLTPVEPDRLSLANAVMRARLAALSDTADSGGIAQRVAQEREISDLLIRMAVPSRNTGLRSWPGKVSPGDETTHNRAPDST